LHTDPFVQIRGRTVWFRWLHRVRVSALVTLVSIVSGCLHPGVSQPQATATTANEASPWEMLVPGLDRRLLQPPQAAFASFIALRIDPTQFRFRVHYRPAEPLFLSDWSALLPDALVIVNGNFFDPANNALGLVVSDGARFGSPYVGMGGLLEVKQDSVRVRSTIDEPVHVDEVFDQVIQGFPVLISGRRAAYTTAQSDRPSRRTVVAQDGSGRILIIASTTLVGLTLVDLSSWLAQTDLDLVTAINLDGGGSTLLLARGSTGSITIPSFDAVPTVLALYSR